jgi:hypothetical protein
VILRLLGWVAPKRDRWVSALQRQGGEVHVAVTSTIVQMSTQFMLHVVMVQEKIMYVVMNTALVMQKMKPACAGRWRLSRMADGR